MIHRHGITRRDFVRCVASGAASICLPGCTAPSRRAAPAPGEQPASKLTEREPFRRLADAALEATSADHIFVSLHERIGGLTQFHNDRITDHANDRTAHISITVAFDQQLGSASTAELTDDALANAVSQAEQKAQRALPKPDYLAPLPPQRYPVLSTYRLATATAGCARRAADAPEVVRLYEAANLQVSGIIATSTEAVGLAADTGLFAFEQRTLAELDVTSIGSDVPVKVANANRSIDDLGVVERARRAVSRAKWLATPRTLPPGQYTVILEPTAVAQLLRPLLDAADARGHLGNSVALYDKLGERIIDPRFTLRNRPDHPALLGNGFDAIGLPANARTWIERGVLTQLYFDRHSARDHEASPTFAPDAWYLSGVDPAGESTDDLIRTTEHGILVTSLGHVRCLDPSDLTLTGHTCDGTFLIENGEIVAGMTNLAWRGSPLRIFNQVQAITTPLDALVAPNAVPDEALTSGIRKLLVPAMEIRDFSVMG